MSKADLINELRYQYPVSKEVAVGECLTDWCSAGSRGGVYCKNCAERRLGEEISYEQASRFASMLSVQQSVARNLEEFTKEILKEQ